MFMKRRRFPSSSHTRARNPEYVSSTRAMISRTVPGSTSMTSASAVIRRSAVGIVSLSDILDSPFGNRILGSRLSGDLRNCGLELSNLRFDRYRPRKLNGFRCLQPVACNGDDRQIIRLYASLIDELPGHCDSNPSCSLGEDSFRLCEQPNSPDDLIVRNIFGPAAAFLDQASRMVAISWVSNRKRFSDGGRLDRLNLPRIPFDRRCNWIATGSLCSEQSGPHFFFKQAESLQFFQAFVNPG